MSLPKVDLLCESYNPFLLCGGSFFVKQWTRCAICMNVGVSVWQHRRILAILEDFMKLHSIPYGWLDGGNRSRLILNIELVGLCHIICPQTSSLLLVPLIPLQTRTQQARTPSAHLHPIGHPPIAFSPPLNKLDPSHHHTQARSLFMCNFLAMRNVSLAQKLTPHSRIHDRSKWVFLHSSDSVPEFGLLDSDSTPSIISVG